MGTIIHKTLIVTGYMQLDNPKHSPVIEARKTAKKVFTGQVSKLIKHPINGDATFMVTSSGSKLGWSHSLEHDLNIVLFVELYQTAGIEIILIEHGECDPVVTRLT